MKIAIAMFIGLVVYALGIAAGLSLSRVLSYNLLSSHEEKYDFISNALSLGRALSLPIVSGAVVGFLIGKKGWLYGGVIGVFPTLFFMVLLVYFFRNWQTVAPHFSQAEASAYLRAATLLMTIRGVLTILLASLGGILGSYIKSKVVHS